MRSNSHKNRKWQLSSHPFTKKFIFLALQPRYEEILAFRLSEAIQKRIQELLTKNKVGRLTLDEQGKLDEYEQLEHFVRMLKLYTITLIENIKSSSRP